MSLSLDRFNFDQAKFIAMHQALWTTQEGKPHLVYLKCDCIDDCLKHFLDTVRIRILQAQKDPSIRCTDPQVRKPGFISQHGADISVYAAGPGFY